jgi:stage V sporulation protein D (sporulation-specific penicillin-binding protein)
MFKSQLSRIRLLSGFIVLVALFFIVRLFYIQIVNGESYAENADKSYVSSGDTFDRGTIYFGKKDGSYLSAGTIRLGYKLAINPMKVLDPEQLYIDLSEYLELEEEDFIARASKPTDPYEEIVTQLDEELANTIKEKEFAGVTLFKHKWRFYPGETLASQTVGFLGFNKGDDLTGQYGIERSYEHVLSRSGSRLYVNAFAEIFANLNRTIFSNEEEEGDVVLTIEPTVQNFVESTLAEVVEKYNADSGSVLIVNPTNGEVVSMASYPNFDLNNFSGVEDSGVFSNPVVENVYEFGSIIKPLILAAAFDVDAVNEETSYFDSGSVWVEDKEIFNFDKEGRGQVNMKDVLAQSLNTGMVFIEQAMGKDVLKEYLFKYQLDQRTNIDLPNEASPLVGNLQSPRELEFATASFGQGIAFNMVVLTKALSALANGGTLVEPHVVSKIIYDQGGSLVVEKELLDKNRVLKPETSERITRVLVENFDNLLEGKYNIEKHSIAVKTGTAQVPNPSGGYYDDRNRHSFVGYFPAFDPEFLVFYTLEYPKGVRYASLSLTEPFMDTTHFLISYYNILPDR